MTGAPAPARVPSESTGRADPLPATSRPFEARLSAAVPEKRAIAALAKTLVSPGDTVALDGSSTSYFLALELRDVPDLVVVTNGLRIAEVFADRPQVTVMIMGGIFRGAASMSVVGDFGQVVPSGGEIAIGFFAPAGASVKDGLMEIRPDEASTKHRISQRCRRVVGVFDSRKVDQFAVVPFVRPERVDVIVTDDATPRRTLDGWAEHGVRTLVASVSRRTGDGG